METSIRDTSPEVLVVEDDLLFSVRIEKTLQKLGYRPFVIGDREAALEHAAARTPVLTIVNFNSEKLEAAELVERLKALPNPAPVLGFVSHTWIPQVRPNAMAAGCDLLVANSVVAMRLPQLMEKLAPRDGSAIRMAEAVQMAAEDED